MKRNVQFAAIALASAMLSCFGARAQTPAPGGVATGLTQWYRADEGVVSGGDGTNVTSWTDFAGGTVSAQIGTAPRPFFKAGATNYLNFNPGVNFTAVQQMLGNIATQTLSNTSFDIFTLTKEGMTGTRFFNIGMNNTAMNGTNWDQPGLYVDGRIGSRNSTGGALTISNPGNIDFSANTPSIMYHTFTNTTIMKGVNGDALGSVLNVSARGQSTGGHIFGANNGSNPPGGDDGGFTGHIGEIIVYGNGNLSATDRNKVDSYLALKYGITLPANVNYLNSDGTIIWNTAANSTYHNNVAGIINDEASALNQKQSISVNAGKQVIISTIGLANTNVANITPLSDGQSLVWGDNGLVKAPAVAFPGAGTNFRFAAIWKAQNSASAGTVRVAWPAGLTNLKLIQSADETIDGSDVSTDMSANTQVVNGVSYNYADVTLADGEFFTFAAFVQAPGGVAANLLMWHKANDGVPTAGAKNVWKDMSVNGRDVAQNNNADNQPSLVTDATHAADSKNYSFNFNPFYYFDGSNDFFYRENDAYFPSPTSPGSTYGIMHNSASGGWRTPYGWGDDDPNLNRNGDNYYLFRDNGDVINQNLGLNTTPAHLAGMSWKGSGAANNGMYLNLNGRIYSSANTNIGNINNAENFAIGSEGVGLTGNGNEAFQGGVSEVFAYSTDHQNSAGDEKQRINSYLAIKYGITLSNDAGTGTANYLSSKSVVIWDTTANTGYNSNIAGIAKDDNSALHQKQSFSNNAGQQVIIGTNGLGNTNEANAVGLNDGQFLIWGDNGLAKAPGNYNAGLGNGVNVLFKAIWKAQNTDGVGTVRIAWPDGLNNLTLVQSGDETFDGSDIFTPMASNSQTINGITYNYADVTLSNGQYFTFATLVEHAPGGVFAGLSLWYRADIDAANTGDATDITSWRDYASGVVSAQLGTAALPKFKTGATDYFNFNPGVNFTSANQTLGNITVPTVSSQAYDVFTATKEGLAPGGNGRVFSVLVNNTDLAGDIDYWDGIGIMADNRIERMNTAYNFRYLANPGNINWSANSPSIMYNTFTNTTVSKGLNGAANGTTATHTAIGTLTGGHAIGTTQFSGNGSDNAGFTGNIGEVVVYGGGNITAAERNKVDSYLAVKYGVTLSNTNNYITSAGDTVWYASSSASFYNNVAGLGRDNISALHQKQSRSQHANTNNQVTIGLGEIAATNATNPGTIADGQFLVWGDNGQTQAMTNNSSSYFAFTYNGSLDNGRMTKRAWKVQNTAMGQEVLIRFPQASVGNTTFLDEGCSQFVLILADDAGFTTNEYVVPLTSNGTDYEAKHTFPAGVSYFTFGKVNGWAPGVVQLPATITSAPDFSTCASNSWYYAKQTTSTDKYLAIQGMTVTQLGNLDVVIDPVGAEFNGTIHTKLMPRVATATDTGAGTYTGVKVRVYYSQAEMDATTVSGAQKSAWFKFEGDANAVRADINADGLLNPEKAIELVPSSSGVEDGIKYVEFDNITSFSSFVYVSTTNETALPVTLVRFDAVRKGNSALLSWNTSEESANEGFEIQRGALGTSWQTIGFVNGQTKDGNSNALLHYTFSDETPMAGKNYYRLKQVDWNGSSHLSRIAVLDFSADGRGLVLYPNPVAAGALTLDLPESGMLEVKIYNLFGTQVKAYKQSSRVLDLKGLPSGKYVVKIVSSNGRIYEKTFIIP
ncbi:Por secretion system C-terminal sorting domain-containing protein [Dyadobacter soli]|uniref:Por secretion system C-terminal sorting domain-containing protein n=1 Tax=Dyadobacter soli TaxID=659014 RepID=A0A1G7T379_9BACT|nr:T9SS type A sorting domain-containing protein [Dyadobacter soli]SDG29776.1 Por secretion system C-terminal sorting domain-containing protein [Dyadobacter soli]